MDFSSVLSGVGVVGALVAAGAVVKKAYTKVTPTRVSLSLLAVAVIWLTGNLVFRGYRANAFEHVLKENVLTAHETKINKPEEAKAALTSAVAFARENGMTDGFTAVLFEGNQKDNVGVWFQKLEKVLNSLGDDKATDQAIKELNGSSPVNKMLEEIRTPWAKALEDAGIVKDRKVVHPDGIEMHPLNREYTLSFWASILMLVVSTAFTIVLAVRRGYVTW